MKRRELRSYVVETPTRGTQTYVVMAYTAEDARRRVNAHTREAEPVNHETYWEGRVNTVRLDKASEVEPDDTPFMWLPPTEPR